MYIWKASADETVGNPPQHIPQNWQMLILAEGYKEIKYINCLILNRHLMSSPLQDSTRNRKTFVSPLKFLNAKTNLEMFLPQICQ